MTPAIVDAPGPRPSLIRRGPFHTLLRRLGLLDAEALPTFATGLLLAAFSWVPLAVFAALERGLQDAPSGPGFLADFNAYARCLIGPFVLIVTERITEARLGRLLESFAQAGLLPESARSDFLALLRVAGRRSGSALAEFLLLAAAFGLSFASVNHALVVSGGFWAGTPAAGGVEYTLAGWWLLIVSLPLFFFLALRWLWRFGVLTALFWSIRRLPLALVPTHPDRAGGLGFMTLYPKMFVPLVFALSCAVAAASLQEILYADATVRQLGVLAGVWLALMLVICVGPLFAFMPMLARLKETGLIEYGELAARHNREAEAALFAAETSALPGSPTISSLADIGSGFGTIRGIKPLPVELWAIAPLVVATLLPFLAVASVEVPVIDLLKKILSALV